MNEVVNAETDCFIMLTGFVAICTVIVAAWIGCGVLTVQLIQSHF